MAATPSARDRVLDAFENLLITVGERGATMDAAAAAAGVSKGGLLYHFGTKDALVGGLIERLQKFAATDIVLMRDDPAGPVDFLLRTSYYSGDRFDRTIVAVSRLAQSQDTRATDALGVLREGMVAELRRVIEDPVVIETVMLISDGMYYNSMLMAPATASQVELAGVTVTAVIDGIQSLLPESARRRG